MKRVEAYILEAVRTPLGRYGGVLSGVRPDDLTALILGQLVSRTSIAAESIDDVFWGCSNQAGEDNRNVARMGVLIAGLPHEIPAATINRLCGSGMEAVLQAARAIWSGDYDLVLTGGIESMSRAPYSLPKNQTGSFGNLTAYDTALGWRYPNPALEKRIPLESMGETAENIAERYRIGRDRQDEFALESHRRAVRAASEGRFDREIVAVEIPQRKGDPLVIRNDEGPRPDSTIEKLGRLSPVFRKNGTVTAGNSSSLNDGAAGLVVASESFLKKSGSRPLARIVSAGVAGVDPRYMGLGPVPATSRAMGKAGLTTKHMELVELNEAFAVQSLAVMKDMELDPTITNVNGGAIALGHPLGCSGARILTTLVHEMGRRGGRYGLATMCIGVGQGMATVIENVQ